MRLQTEHDPGDVTTAEGWGAADVLSQQGWSEQRTSLACKTLTNWSFVSTGGEKKINTSD